MFIIKNIKGKEKNFVEIYTQGHYFPFLTSICRTSFEFLQYN